MVNKAANKRGQGSRRKLLETGLAQFHANGYAATGVDLISKAAKVPKGSFYNHFGSKEAFGAEVVDTYSERHMAKLRQFLHDERVSPLTRLQSYFDERIATFEKLGCRRGCMMGNLSLVKFLSTPGLWTGLLVAAIFLAAATRLRRYRGPI